MKRLVLLALSLLSLIIFFSSRKEDTIKIPSSAIRFRILANSNSPRDQKIKQDISRRMQKELYNLLENQNNINSARKLIISNLPSFKEILDEEMKDIEYSYKIDYGTHYFPSKTYKGIVYPEGNYESLLVSLGSGQGDNWWCVLFPPLCIMEAEETSKTNVEYKFFIKEIIEKYF